MFDQITNQKFRLIFSPTLSARENMATDEALFASFEKDSLPIFRVYDWEKSFTIGVAQDFSKIPNFEEKELYERNYAKRITGGGVLFHGNDISYSLLVPTSYMKDKTVKESYEKICTFLLEFYKSLGLEVCYAKDNARNILSKSAFCQVGFEAYDIVFNGKKIGGNAQRRTKKCIFQHGSIPLSNISKRHEIGYCLEDFGIYLEIAEAKKSVITAFKNSFNINFENALLTQEEKDKLEILLKDKYDYEK